MTWRTYLSIRWRLFWMDLVCRFVASFERRGYPVHVLLPRERAQLAMDRVSHRERTVYTTEAEKAYSARFTPTPPIEKETFEKMLELGDIEVHTLGGDKKA